MNPRRLALLKLAALLAAPTLVQAQSLSIIDLRHRPAEEVLPIISPLLVPGGSASGSGWQLFVRTTPANLAEIRQVLARIDTPPRQLLISVRQGADSSRVQGWVSGGVSVNSQGQISGGVNARQGESLSVRGGEQTLRVLEGRPARIELATALPFRFQVWTPAGAGWVATEATTYLDAVRGFSVIPQVSGDQVTLEIRPSDEAWQGSGRREGMRLATTVSGPLGQWIALGEANEASARNGSSRQASRSVWVRVEEVQAPR